jgi:hypothetical protein
MRTKGIAFQTHTGFAFQTHTNAHKRVAELPFRPIPMRTKGLPHLKQRQSIAIRVSQFAHLKSNPTVKR